MKRSAEIHPRRPNDISEGEVPVNSMGAVATGPTEGPIAGDNSKRPKPSSLHLFGKGDLHRRDISQQKAHHRTIMRFRDFKNQ